MTKIETYSNIPTAKYMDVIYYKYSGMFNPTRID